MTGLGGGPGTPPGFGPPGQVPELHGQPLAAPGFRGQRGLVALMAFFGVVLVVSAAGFVFTRQKQVDRTFTSTGGMTLGPRPLESESPSGRPQRAVPEPVTYRGSGDKTIRIRKPDSGQTLVYVKGGAAGKMFAVYALDRGGNKVNALVNALAPYEGVRLLEPVSLVSASAIEVDATGPWTVELRSARSAPLAGAVVRGSGDTVFRYEGAAGTATIRGGKASTSFTVLAHAKGLPRLVTVGLAPADARKEWPAGPTLVEVQATGAWSIRVS